MLDYLTPESTFQATATAALELQGAQMSATKALISSYARIKPLGKATRTRMVGHNLEKGLPGGTKVLARFQ